MNAATLLSFAIIAGLLVMTPGPNGVLIAKTVPTSARLVAFANVGGFVAAYYLHGALSFFGIALLLVQSAQLFMVVKLLGAAYLCWIGVRALLDAWRGPAAVQPQPGTAPPARRRTLAAAFIEGFASNALNPKVSMFYLAAFPQFLPAGEASATNTFLLVFIHSMLNLAWFTTLIMVFSRISAVARGGATQRWIKGVTGAVFLGFGFKLATTRL